MRGDTTRPDVSARLGATTATTTVDQDRAAVMAIARRVRTGLITPAAAYDALDALGLADVAHEIRLEQRAHQPAAAT